ncbi:MAG: hypothetical protein WAL10_00840, partial [Acetobacteraceae bacterium]
SFYTTFQKMSLKLGIAVSAAVLAASIHMLGHQQPLLSDFSVALLVVSAISLAAPITSLRLDRAAGAEVSGHRDRKTRPRVAVAE